jgi:alkylation response protein AidB-like acyl-CoA dehydrogenase
MAMAATQASSLSTILLRDRPLVQRRLAQAEAIVKGACCYVIDSLPRVWSASPATEIDTAQAIAHLRLAVTHAIHESVRAVDLVFHAPGTNAIFTDNPLERAFRDIHVAVQHAVAFPVHFEVAGKALMGLRPSEPGW